MKLIKRLIVKFIHHFGYDLYRVQKDSQSSMLGLYAFNINTVIDIGANRGQFAQRVIQIFPQAHFYCFEPLPDAFHELEKWATLYPGKFTLFNIALGEKSGVVTLYSPVDHNDASSILKSTKTHELLHPVVKKQRQVIVEMKTLDSVLTGISGEFSPNILIKMDVEGYEDRVIRGGSEIFKLATACIVEICFDELHHEQASFDAIYTLMNSRGYVYAGSIDQICAPDGHPIYINAVFIRDGNTS